MKLAPNKDFQIVLALLLIVLIPAVITLSSIDLPRPVVALENNPTPFGYTWSLALFIVPILTILFWFLRRPRPFYISRAFLYTVIALPLVGFILDLFLGTLFFTFENRAATLNLWVGAFNWDKLQWLSHQLPIEEFIFYTAGVRASLCIYVWCDEYWLQAYQYKGHQEISQKIPRLIQFHANSVWVALSLVLAAWLYKKFGPHPYHEGFPGYFTFMVVAAMLPSMLLFPSVKNIINWRAVSFTGFVLLLISLLWEATIGVPYQYWGYKERQMIGLHIGAWFSLPAEEPNLWLSITYVTVIIYETLKLWLHSRRSFTSSFFARSSSVRP